MTVATLRYQSCRNSSPARCDIHSAEQILPDLPPPVVGGEFRLLPDVALSVAVVEAGRALVVTGGVPMGTVPAPYASTWAFILLDGRGGTTRLVTRERYLSLRPLAGVLLEPVALASFVMTERMLRGIRDRAESRHAGEHHPHARPAPGGPGDADR